MSFNSMLKIDMDDYSGFKTKSQELEEKNTQIENLERQLKKLEEDNQEYKKNMELLRADIKQLTEEIQKKDDLITELRGIKGTNIRKAGRKRTQDLWKEDIFELWKEGVKDNQIYGHLAKRDEKGEFHVLSKATYYRIKERYYQQFLSQLCSK
jgi:chromosome segregation ATPase